MPLNFFSHKKAQKSQEEEKHFVLFVLLCG